MWVLWKIALKPLPSVRPSDALWSEGGEGRTFAKSFVCVFCWIFNLILAFLDLHLKLLGKIFIILNSDCYCLPYSDTNPWYVNIK